MTTPHRQDDELLPCPFCGCSKIDVYSDDGDHIAEISKCYAVQCYKCGARAPVATKKEAIAAWNARAAPASRDGAERTGDIDALAEIWRVCDRASHYSKSCLVAAIVGIVEAQTKARAATPPKGDYAGLDRRSKSFYSRVRQGCRLLCKIGIFIWAWGALAQAQNISADHHRESGANARLTMPKVELVGSIEHVNYDKQFRFAGEGSEIADLTRSDRYLVRRELRVALVGENEHASRIACGRWCLRLATVSAPLPSDAALYARQTWQSPSIFHNEFDAPEIVCIVSLNIQGKRFWPQCNFDVGTNIYLISLSGGSCCGLESNVGVMEYRHLPKNPDSGEHHENERGYLDYLFYGILSAIVLAGGIGCLYQSIFKNSDSLSRGVIWLLLAWPAIFIGVSVFLIGVLGWHNPLAPFNRRSENVRVAPMVVAELKFRDVERHILSADLVERTHDTALEDAPKAFNRVGVDRADAILSLQSSPAALSDTSGDGGGR